MESFFGILKNEMFYGHESEFRTFSDLKKTVTGYIDHYNNERIRERTRWLPPAEYRKAASQADL